MRQRHFRTSGSQPVEQHPTRQRRPTAGMPLATGNAYAFDEVLPSCNKRLPPPLPAGVPTWLIMATWLLLAAQTQMVWQIWAQPVRQVATFTWSAGQLWPGM